MKKILIIDDDQSLLNYLNVILLQTEEYDVSLLSDSEQACKKIHSNTYDIILLDMVMPCVTGLYILKYIKENHINVETIVFTGAGDVETAVSSMKMGAFDYLRKPLDREDLLTVIKKAIEKKELKHCEISFKESSLDELEFKEVFSDIITQSKNMIRIFQIVEKIALTDSSILIWGESGTGKELIAKAIHQISKRKNENFIAVNAGIFANELFTSEFFGHIKGAFSGAASNKKGFIEEANRGTLFLDEIGELSLPIQVKLLRVLQEGEFFRLGSTQNMKVDVRIVAATNKDLQEEIKKGNFRKDLFYRLNMNSVYLPPLMERAGDIPLLAYHFLKQFNKLNNKNIRTISDTVLKLLNNYDYPGNVRELMNIINSATIVESSGELRKKSLPQYFLDNTNNCVIFPGSNMKSKTLQEVEKDHIMKVLEYCEGNRTKASKILGISRVNLIAKIKRYGLEK